MFPFQKKKLPPNSDELAQHRLESLEGALIATGTVSSERTQLPVPDELALKILASMGLNQALHTRQTNRAFRNLFNMLLLDRLKQHFDAYPFAARHFFQQASTHFARPFGTPFSLATLPVSKALLGDFLNAIDYANTAEQPKVASERLKFTVTFLALNSPARKNVERFAERTNTSVSDILTELRKGGEVETIDISLKQLFKTVVPTFPVLPVTWETFQQPFSNRLSGALSNFTAFIDREGSDLPAWLTQETIQSLVSELSPTTTLIEMRQRQRDELYSTLKKESRLEDSPSVLSREETARQENERRNVALWKLLIQLVAYGTERELMWFLDALATFDLNHTFLFKVLDHVQYVADELHFRSHSIDIFAKICANNWLEVLEHILNIIDTLPSPTGNNEPEAGRETSEKLAYITWILESIWLRGSKTAFDKLITKFGNNLIRSLIPQINRELPSLTITSHVEIFSEIFALIYPQLEAAENKLSLYLCFFSSRLIVDADQKHAIFLEKLAFEPSAEREKILEMAIINACFTGYTEGIKRLLASECVAKNSELFERLIKLFLFENEEIRGTIAGMYPFYQEEVPFILEGMDHIVSLMPNDIDKKTFFKNHFKVARDVPNFKIMLHCLHQLRTLDPTDKLVKEAFFEEDSHSKAPRMAFLFSEHALYNLAISHGINNEQLMQWKPLMPWEKEGLDKIELPTDPLTKSLSLLPKSYHPHAQFYVKLHTFSSELANQFQTLLIRALLGASVHQYNPKPDYLKILFAYVDQENIEHQLFSLMNEKETQEAISVYFRNYPKNPDKGLEKWLADIKSAKISEVFSIQLFLLTLNIIKTYHHLCSHPQIFENFNTYEKAIQKKIATFQDASGNIVLIQNILQAIASETLNASLKTFLQDLLTSNFISWDAIVEEMNKLPHELITNDLMNFVNHQLTHPIYHPYPVQLAAFNLKNLTPSSGCDNKYRVFTPRSGLFL